MNSFQSGVLVPTPPPMGRANIERELIAAGTGNSILSSDTYFGVARGVLGQRGVTAAREPVISSNVLR